MWNKTEIIVKKIINITLLFVSGKFVSCKVAGDINKSHDVSISSALCFTSENNLQTV